MSTNTTTIDRATAATAATTGSRGGGGWQRWQQKAAPYLFLSPFLILFCVVGGLCTSGSDPLASSHREEVGRKPAPCGVRDGNRGIIAR